ncbi:MAG: AIR synthase related protein [Sedimentisphaeraceae bacterium JB056]
MREENFIEDVISRFERSSQQKNKPFTCDAEIVEISGKFWAVTVDEFSPQEDLFFDTDAYLLGQNLATATLSDLFACGAKPQFFLHSVVAGEKMESAFFDGLNDVLEQCGCFLLGGDTGGGEYFRYTAIAMGQIENEKIISRVMPCDEQLLWITGSVGDANLSAFSQKSMPQFELRIEESEFIAANAASCIDTSGGLIDALWMLKKVNPDMRFEIDADMIPFDIKVKEFCKAAGLPPMAFAFGGAGEYELLFTTPYSVKPPFAATCIGRCCSDQESGIYIKTDDKSRRIKDAPPCGREIKDKDAYVKKILEQVNDIIC